MGDGHRARQYLEVAAGERRWSSPVLTTGRPCLQRGWPATRSPGAESRQSRDRAVPGTVPGCRPAACRVCCCSSVRRAQFSKAAWPSNATRRTEMTGTAVVPGELAGQYAACMRQAGRAGRAAERPRRLAARPLSSAPFTCPRPCAATLRLAGSASCGQSLPPFPVSGFGECASADRLRRYCPISARLRVTLGAQGRFGASVLPRMPSTAASWLSAPTAEQATHAAAAPDQLPGATQPAEVDLAGTLTA